MTTTVIPRQKGPPPIEEFDRNAIPVVGTQAFIDAMIAEKEEGAAA